MYTPREGHSFNIDHTSRVMEGSPNEVLVGCTIFIVSSALTLWLQSFHSELWLSRHLFFKMSLRAENDAENEISVHCFNTDDLKHEEIGLLGHLVSKMRLGLTEGIIGLGE